MTRHSKLVAFWIPNIRAVVVGVVLRSQAGRTLTGATVCQSGLVGSTDLLSTCSQERNHLPIPRIVRLTVVGLANDKKWARPALTVPAGPGALRLRKAKLISKATHHCVVERERSLEVTDTDKDVGQHFASILGLGPSPTRWEELQHFVASTIKGAGGSPAEPPIKAMGPIGEIRGAIQVGGQECQNCDLAGRFL
jgi:hypothetical protein